MSNNSTKLLESYIFTILKENQLILLKEEDGYDGGYGGAYGWSGSTKGFEGFWTPFTDVLKTAAGATKMILSKAWMVAQVFVRGVANILTPFMNKSYYDIFEKERERTSRIRQKYQKIFDKNTDALFVKDAWLITFLLNPSVGIAVATARATSPTALNNVMGFIEMATAKTTKTGPRLDNFGRQIYKTDGSGQFVYNTDEQGNFLDTNNRIIVTHDGHVLDAHGNVMPDANAQQAVQAARIPEQSVSYQRNSNIGKVTDHIRNTFASWTRTKNTNTRMTNPTYGFGSDLSDSVVRFSTKGNQILFEQTAQSGQQPPAFKLDAKTLSTLSQEFINSPTGKSMHDDALGVVTETANYIVQKVEAVMKAKTLEEVQSTITKLAKNTQVDFSKAKGYKEFEDKIKELKTKGDKESLEAAKKEELSILVTVKKEFQVAHAQLAKHIRNFYFKNQCAEAVGVYNQTISKINSFNPEQS